MNWLTRSHWSELSVWARYQSQYCLPHTAVSHKWGCEDHEISSVFGRERKGPSDFTAGEFHLCLQISFKGPWVILLRSAQHDNDTMPQMSVLEASYPPWNNLTLSNSGRTRGSGCKLEEGRLMLDVRRKFFTQSVVRHWHSCPWKLWVPPPWRCSRLGWMGPWQPKLMGGSWPKVGSCNQVNFKVPSNPSHSMILHFCDSILQWFYEPLSLLVPSHWISLNPSIPYFANGKI